LFALKEGETIVAVKQELNTLCFMVSNYSKASKSMRNNNSIHGTELALLIPSNGKGVPVLSFRTIPILKMRYICFRRRAIMMAEGII